MANGDLALPRTLGRRLGALPVAFGLLIVFVVSYGLSHSWKATIGALLDSIAGVGISVPHLPAVHPFRFVGKANRAIERWFSDAQKYSERGVVWGINNAVELPLLLAGTTAAIGMSIFELGEWTADYVRKVVGAQHAARTDPRLRQLQTDILRDEARLRDLERYKRAGGAAAGAQDWAKINRGIDRLKSRVDDLERAQHGKASADVHTGARAIPDVLGVPHWLSRRLSRVEKATVGIGAAALTAAALARLGLGWLRCPALGRIGRKVGCGGFGWLEGFLATTFEALVVLDLCRFALAAQRLAKFVVPQLAGTLLVQNAVCLGGGASYPSAHDAPNTLTKITYPSAHD